MNEQHKNNTHNHFAATMIGSALGATAALFALGIIGPAFSDAHFRYLLGPGILIIFALGALIGSIVYGISHSLPEKLAGWQVIALSNFLFAIPVFATMDHGDTLGVRAITLILACGTGCGLGAVYGRKLSSK